MKTSSNEKSSLRAHVSPGRFTLSVVPWEPTNPSYDIPLFFFKFDLLLLLSAVGVLWLLLNEGIHGLSLLAGLFCGLFLVWRVGAFCYALQERIVSLLPQRLTEESYQLSFSPSTLSVSPRHGQRPATYALAGITNMRTEAYPTGYGERLVFDYKDGTIECCRYLQPETGQALLQHIEDVVTVRYHLVTDIVFGISLSSLPSGPHVLYNPDVSDLTWPFAALQTLHLDMATYSPYTVEQFLTYAVNFIGQRRLKQAIDVRLYGDRDKLHTNLRNSLTSLCHQISCLPSGDMELPLNA